MATRVTRWKCGHRLWIELDGQVLLGKGRVALLEAIERDRSIRKAAASVGMSYRRAWLLVQSMNAAASQPLVATATGGVHGGGTRLTEHGRFAISVFYRLESTVEKATKRLLDSL
jgi:molybdate transport system regulatory protein